MKYIAFYYGTDWKTRGFRNEQCSSWNLFSVVRSNKEHSGGLRRREMKKKNLKKLLAISVIGAVLTGSMSVYAENAADPAVESKTIKVGMEGTYAPYTYHDEEGELTGFEVDVAKAIGEKIGYDVEFVEIEWDSIFEALEAGTIDVVMNQVTITDEREEKYDFTTPYVYTQPVLIVKSDNEDVKTFEDIKGLRAAEGLTSNYNQLKLPIAKMGLVP